MHDCIFCKISRKEIQAFTVYENDDVMAFLDIDPAAPGHTLVVPKSHAASFLDLPDTSIGPFFSAVKRLCRDIISAIGADGATVGINHGEAGGQVVPHLHAHIIPRFHGDGGGSVQSVVGNKPKESLEEIRDKIMNAG